MLDLSGGNVAYDHDERLARLLVDIPKRLGSYARDFLDECPERFAAVHAEFTGISEDIFRLCRESDGILDDASFHGIT